MKRVVITGMGIISPIGNTIDQVADSLHTGRSGVRKMPEWESIGGLKSHVAGVAEDFDERQIARQHRRTMGKMAIMATLAARDAIADAGLPADELPERTGVAMGSTTGSPVAMDQFFSSFGVTRSIESTEGTLFMKVMNHTVAANVAAALGCRGRMLSIGSACSSSTQAIGAGFEAIRYGLQDIMVCGGADEVHPTSAGVFDVLAAASRNFNHSPQSTPRPFDRDRDGLVVSEGAGAIILESYDAARARNATVYGEILGYSTTCSCEHMTQAGAQAMLECILDAVDVAGISPADIDYINAHATGTLAGDAAEAEAIRAFAGDAIHVGATKGYTGHTLAACGVMEVIFSLLMMQRGFIARSLNLENVAPECEGIAHVLTRLDKGPEVVLTSNFAFGSVNASLVLRRTP